MPSSDSREAEAGAESASADAMDAIGRSFGRLSEWLALIGGVIMLIIVAMTVISIVGRFFFNLPVRGDFELTELACAVAAFLFFPYTQHTGQNLVADFFTSALSGRWRARIEAIHTLIFAIVAAFLAWRLFEGMVDKFETSSHTMLVGIPLWWGYLAGIPAFILLALICLWGSARLAFADRR